MFVFKVAAYNTSNDTMFAGELW